MTDQHVAVITGAASGIGKATAVAYARSGVHIVVGYHAADPYDPELVLREIAEAGGKGVIQEVDVRSTDQVENFAERALQEWGRLDIAVANSGVLRRVPITELDDTQWNDLLDIDLTGVLRTFRAASSRIAGSGSMVAISSIAGGIYGWSEHAHYAAAKAGIIALVRSLAIELGTRGIRVNAVIPGTIDTPQAQDAVNSLGAVGIAAQGAELPLGRAGTAGEIAGAIEFLTSERASFITGASLVVDGGMTALMPR